MRKLALGLVAAISLTACPEPIPVDENSTMQPSPVQDGKPADGPGTQVVGAPAAASGAGGPLAAGTFGGIIPESELKPKFTQEALEAEGGVKISGELICKDCKGKLLVRVLPPPTEPGDVGGDSAGDIQLMAAKAFDGPGPFELMAPVGAGAVLQVVDDANSDGKPSSGERMGMNAEGPVALGAEVTGVTLQVGVFPSMPEKDAMGKPLTGAMEGPSNPAAPVDAPVVPDGAAALDGAAPPPAEVAAPE